MKLSANPNMHLLGSGRPYGSRDTVSTHNKMNTCTSNEFSYKMNGKITGWGAFRTCPNAPGPKSCTIRCMKWIFLLTVTRTLICCVKWKLLNTGAAWLFMNQGSKNSNKLKVLHSPPQWGHQKWEPQKRGDESQRTVGLPRGSCTLADPSGGLSLRENQNKQRGHHLVV